jgi:IS5 family transposase
MHAVEPLPDPPGPPWRPTHVLEVRPFEGAPSVRHLMLARTEHDEGGIAIATTHAEHRARAERTEWSHCRVRGWLRHGQPTGLAIIESEIWRRPVG